jgi:Amidohydrolase family
MKLLLLAGAVAVSTGFVTAADAQEFLVRGASVHTISAQGTLKDSDVLVRDGVIVAVGTKLAAPPGATVIEANGRPLTPGLYGGLTAIGIEEVSQEPTTVDTTLSQNAPGWNQQWRPELDLTLAFNPRSVLVPVARVEGVTWTVLAPGLGDSDSGTVADSIIGGQSAAVSLDGRFDSVLPGSRVLFVQMGGAGARLAGGTRAGEYMLLDQAIHETRTPGAVSTGALLHAAGREALAHYLNGGRVIFQVDRAADILRVVAFARRNGMNPVISGGSEAWVVARELAQVQVPVILNPLDDLPSDFDRLGSTFDNAARLQSAGVRIAFSSGDGHNARLVRQLAGNAVAHGLSWDAALAAITANPADILGLGATRGRIAAGQVADLVLWSADPLEVSSLADNVWIAGRPIEMRSRQTELRDRYLGPLKLHQTR